MEALGSFASGIAHDFNNYLSAIITNSELLLEDLVDPSDQRAEAEQILSTARSAAGLTRQILMFSRRQMVVAERVDINAVLGDILLLIDRLVGEHISVSSSLDPTIPSVVFDCGQLQQMMMNLASNARDAMPTGGQLAIATQRTSDGGVRITVRDTGHGIPASVRARVFEPFFTTKERGRGTGLGLAMVYRTVASANGRVEVESVEGAGTCFSIWFPAAEAPHEGTSAVRREAEAGGGELVLLVEDDSAVRKSTAAILSRAGYRVISVSGGDEALDTFLDPTFRPALLLTDVVMPGLTGPALSKRLLAIAPTTRVLFMSGYADDDLFATGAERAGVQFVAKPFSGEELRRAVRRALAPLHES